MSAWRSGIEQVRRYPSAVVGLAIIAFLVGLSIYTVIAIPYREALELWRGGEHWRMHPVNAGPLWLDRLTGGNLPETLIVGSREAAVEEKALFDGVRQLHIPLDFDYDFGAFPRSAR